MASHAFNPSDSFMDSSMSSSSSSIAAATSSPASSMSFSQAILLDQSAALSFHNVEYLIRCRIKQAPNSNNATTPSAPDDYQSQSLLIEVEQRVATLSNEEGARWIGEFSAKYIEDMSLKTGSFKRFPLFVKMLASALTKTSDSVFIDLLTFGDLEALKRKKAQNANQEEKAEDSTVNNPLLMAAKNKRYFILTYVGEFDKVHYPLPLKFEDDFSSLDNMTAAINRLKAENLHLKHTLAQTNNQFRAELFRLAEENQRLKALSTPLSASTTSLHHSASSSIDQTAATPETTTTSGSAADASNSSSTVLSSSTSTSTLSPSQLQQELENSREECRLLRGQFEAKSLEAADLVQRVQGLMAGMPVEALNLHSQLMQAHQQLWKAQDEIRKLQSQARKDKSKHQREQQVMMEELERRLEAERQLRVKCRKLMTDLEAAQSTSSSSTGSRGRTRLSNTSTHSPARRSASPSHGGSTASSSRLERIYGRGASNTSSPSQSRSSSRHASPGPSTPQRGLSPSSSQSQPFKGSHRSRTPSPSGGRFDPSAYVKQKQKQQEEMQSRLQEERRHSIRHGGRNRSPSPGTNSSPSHHHRVHRSDSTERLSRTSSRGNSPAASRSASTASLARTTPTRGSSSSQSSRLNKTQSEVVLNSKHSKSNVTLHDPPSAAEVRSSSSRGDPHALDQRMAKLQDFLKNQKH